MTILDPNSLQCYNKWFTHKCHALVNNYFADIGFLYIELLFQYCAHTAVKGNTPESERIFIWKPAPSSLTFINPPVNYLQDVDSLTRLCCCSPCFRRCFLSIASWLLTTTTSVSVFFIHNSNSKQLAVIVQPLIQISCAFIW